MPTISMFLGIIIRMYNTGEHNPPHFHASYQGQNAVFDLNGELLEGDMPKRQQNLLQHGRNCIRTNYLQTGSLQ